MKLVHLLFPPFKKYNDQKYDYDLSFYNRRVRAFLKYAWRDSATPLKDDDFLVGLYKYRLYRFLDMVWCFFRYGCPTDNYRTFEFYKLNSSYRNSYLTLRRRISLVRSRIDFDTYRSFLRKDVFNDIYKDFIKRDWILLESPSAFESLDKMISQHKELICKPLDSHCGKGVIKVTEDNLQIIKDEVSNGARYLCEQCIYNCPELKQPNPSSLNTIRVNTFVDKTGKAKVIDMVLRVGAWGSVVDNLYHGGVCYPINNCGMITTYGMNTKHERYYFHPGTNFKMIGFEIPRYKEIVKYVESIAERNPKAKFVGWDIAITENSFDLIEGNLASSEDATQLYGIGTYQFMKKNW